MSWYIFLEILMISLFIYQCSIQLIQVPSHSLSVRFLMAISYYSFRMKTFDFFKLEHIQQLKVSYRLSMAEIDVNYHFVF